MTHTRIAAALAGILILSGCAPIVALKPAENANDPGCAAVIVRLPDTVSGLAIRQTDAQSTAAWGEPDQVLLFCGVEVPTASELPCIDKGIFWLRDDSDDAVWTFTSFGRDPAVRLIVDRDPAISPGLVLEDLENAVSFTPVNGLTCTDTEETVTGQDPFSEPSPAPTG
jgi:hypothetical protein